MKLVVIWLGGESSDLFQGKGSLHCHYWFHRAGNFVHVISFATITFTSVLSGFMVGSLLFFCHINSSMPSKLHTKLMKGKAGTLSPKKQARKATRRARAHATRQDLGLIVTETIHDYEVLPGYQSLLLDGIY